MYPYAVQSISAHHQPLANNANVFNVRAQAINKETQMGTQIEPGAVTDAEDTVMTLQGVKNQIPEAITDAVIETAKNRAHLHAAVEFEVAPAIVGNLQQVAAPNTTTTTATIATTSPRRLGTPTTTARTTTSTTRSFPSAIGTTACPNGSNDCKPSNSLPKPARCERPAKATSKT